MVNRSEAEILEILRLGLGLDEIGLESELNSPPSWDSIRHVALFVYLKRNLNISTPIEKISDLKSIRQIIDFVSNHSMAG